jgi:hypothetical protein
MTYPALSTAVDYLHRRGVSVPGEVAALAKGRAVKDAGYEAVRQSLWASVYDAVIGFLSGNSQVGTFSRPMATEVASAYIQTSEIAYVDGGAELPLDPDTQAWAKAEMDAQLAYVDSLFERLKAMRKEGDFDAIHEAFAAADRWASALTGFYNAVKLAGAGNQLLEWRLGRTERHCKDCAKLDGQRHRASWFRSRGYYPKMPGSATECGGWNCDCSLVTKDGQEFSL